VEAILKNIIIIVLLASIHITSSRAKMAGASATKTITTKATMTTTKTTTTTTTSTTVVQDVAVVAKVSKLPLGVLVVVVALVHIIKGTGMGCSLSIASAWWSRDRCPRSRRTSHTSRSTVVVVPVLLVISKIVLVMNRDRNNVRSSVLSNNDFYYL